MHSFNKRQQVGSPRHMSRDEWFKFTIVDESALYRHSGAIFQKHTSSSLIIGSLRLDKRRFATCIKCM